MIPHNWVRNEVSDGQDDPITIGPVYVNWS